MLRLHPALALLLVFVLIPTAAATELQRLAVNGGSCECVLPTEYADDQYLLILGSLAQTGGPHPVRITTVQTTAALSIPLEAPRIDLAWQKHVRDLAERQAVARRERLASAMFAPLQAPPREKVFHLFVKDADFQNPASYVAVTAELRGIGKHCQVYVDRDHADVAGLQPTIDDAIRTFDNNVWPRSLGSTLDVDRDGRFTILFSGWLAKMPSGAVKLSGFVRGSDFLRDLAAPFGNRCDMMYLSTDLKPGPFLSTLIAHEHTHAAVFSEHVFGDYVPGIPRQDEQSWLNEAIAHLVEDYHGFSWANLDYRLSAFLNAPSRYSLVVPDYYAAKVWRDPGTRGCTYLFLRWCVDRFGPELLTRLVQSNLTGLENLEVATQTPFAELFRQWSAALAMSGNGIDVDNLLPFRDTNMHGKLANRLLCGPRCVPLMLNSGRQDISLASTSPAFVLLHSPTGTRSQVTLSCNPSAELQVSVIRLPPLLPRLEMRCEINAAGWLVVSLMPHHGDVLIKEAGWERLVTTDQAQDETCFRCDENVRDWFDQSALSAGETQRSAAMHVPPGELIFKVNGMDGRGHVISAWAVIQSPSP